MTDRLRFLLDRPLDPLAARAVLVLATAVLLGFAAVIVLGESESDRGAALRGHAELAPPQPRLSLGSTPLDAVPPAAQRLPSARRQDPQDKKDSAAGRRAARTLRSHRALQHVPYRRGALAIQLVGARGGRAVLRVSAPTIAGARSGWQGFLRRYGDGGRAYVPLFTAGGGHESRGGV
jgi:hypothetical protein